MLDSAFSMRSPNLSFRDDATWRQTGNLRGEIPVSEDLEPPDKRVIEDAELFAGLWAWAASIRYEQRLRADRLAGQPEGPPQDGRFWFAESYARVSEELTKAVESGRFQYPSFVLLSIAYFDVVYRDNFEAFQVRGTCEAHWEFAFRLSYGDWSAIARSALGPGLADAALGLFCLGRSAHAHLRFDLCRALAWAYSNHYPTGADAPGLGAFEADFFGMGEVFDAVTVQMKAVIEARTGVPLSSIPGQVPWLDGWLDTSEVGTVLGFGTPLAEERRRTWDRATEIAAGFSPLAFICVLDGASGGLRVPHFLGSLNDGVSQLDGEKVDFLGFLEQLADPPSMDIRPETQFLIDQFFAAGR